MANLLLIDSRVSDIDAILSSLTSNTEYIVFSYAEDTFQTLQSKIADKSSAFSNIAIAQHKYNISTFSLTSDMYPATLFDVSSVDPYIETWQPFIGFIDWLRENVGMQCLDLLACDLWSDPNWVFVIETLKSRCSVLIRASIDITGYGGDFILESDNVDLVGIYFTEAILNYKYSFVGNDFITLINTKSPWGVYSATEYSNVTNKLYEIRGNGRDATTSGTFTPGSATGNGATGAIKFLNGTTTSIATWPSGSLPSTLTVALITRYTNASANQQRILTSTNNSPNTSIGHYINKRGVSYLNGTWITQSTSNVGTATNWLNMVVKSGGTTPNNVLIDGGASGTATNTSTTGTLSINGYSSGGFSDFGFSYLMVWAQALTDAEMVIVSGQLAFYLTTGNPPPVLTGFQTVLNTKRPWGIYRAVDWNSGTGVLPEARGITARNATKTGTITYTASETGNGANANISLISGTTASELAWPAGSIPAIYTIAFIDRMISNPGRVFQATTNNMLFGHWSGEGKRGVYFESSQFINSTSYGTIVNWLAMVCKVGASPNNCIVDGVGRGTVASVGIASADTLKINNGNNFNEDSNWALSYLMIWDQALTDAEAAIVSNELLSYLGTGTLPATTDFVLNGYFTGPALSANSFTQYASPYAAIVNWTITRTGGTLIYIANQSTSWGYSSLPAGVTQWLVVQTGAGGGTLSVTQNIYFGATGLYALTYYTQTRPGQPTNLITLDASIAGASQSSLVNVTNWELRTLNFTIASVGTQTLTLNTSTSSSNDISIYLTGINVAPINISLTTPGTPTLNAVTAGNQQVSVAFTAPASDGNSTITDYTYSTNGGSTFVSAGTIVSPFTISSLAINTTYSIVLRAVNVVGDSSNSNLISATTFNYPDAPTINSATGGLNSITIAFTAPAQTGGTAITNYTYSLDNITYTSAGTTASPILVSGLSGNASYTVYLKAVNVVGSSAASNSVSTFVYNAPSKPTIQVSSGNNSVIVSSVVSASDGGSAITSYNYSVDNISFTSTGNTTLPFTIPSLIAGTTYTIYVKSSNVYGVSVASDASSVLVLTLPNPPVITSVVSGISTTLTINYTAPVFTGYTSLTDYQVSVDAGSTFTSYGSADQNPLVITGLTNGETYSVVLKATNIIGSSINSNTIVETLSLVSDPPVISCVSGPQQIDISFTLPNNTGYTPILYYVYTLNGGSDVSFNANTVSPYTITGLQNGTTYLVNMAIVNRIGKSSYSNSVSVIPYTSPSSLQITSLQSSPHSLLVSYSVQTNGSALSSVSYSLNGLSNVSAGTLSSPFLIPNLIEGMTYSIQLTVENQGGNALSDVSFVFLNYSYAVEKALSMDTDGNVFVLTLRNELNDSYHYKTSFDGVNWSAEQFPVSYLQTHNPYQIKWTGSQFVVLGNILSDNSGNTPAFLKSNDGLEFGITIASSTLPNYTYDFGSNDEFPHTVVFPQDTTLVCGAYTGTPIAYSRDSGNTWTASSNASSVFSVSANAAVWTGRMWVAVGEGAQHTIATSENGDAWIGSSNRVFSVRGNSIAWNANTYLMVAVGESASSAPIAWSHDGMFWVNVDISGLDVGVKVEWNETLQQWIVYGTTTVSSATVWVSVSSSNGKTWDTPSIIGSTAPTFSTIIWNRAQYLRVLDISQNLEWRMDEVQNWQSMVSPPAFLSQLKHVAWNYSNVGMPRILPITLALGEDDVHTLAWSEDGIKWYGLGKSVFQTRTNDAIWTGQFWVAVGVSVNSWCATSYNGLVWINSTNDMFTEGTCIAWNGQFLVAGGINGEQSRLAISLDGLEWSAVDVSAPVRQILWNGTEWLVFFTTITNQCLSSTDAFQWSWKSVPSPHINVIPTPSRLLFQTDTSGNFTITDRSCNVITTTTYAGLDATIQGSTYNGTQLILGLSNGKVGFLQDISGVFTTTLSPADAITSCACNTKYILVSCGTNGGVKYAPLELEAGMSWYSALFVGMQNVKKVVSNSGYGWVDIPNAISFNQNDKLDIVCPRHITVPQTHFAIDLMKS